MNRAVRNTLLVILFAVVVAAGVYGVPAALRYFMGVDQPLLTVVSHSMWPALNRGDIVVVKATNIEDIEVSSVIVFRHERGLTVHRVASLNEWTITTRGDANVQDDSPILYSDVVGQVPAIGSRLLKIPWVGQISLMVKPEAGTGTPGEITEVDFWARLQRLILSPLGFLVIIGFPLLLLFQNVLSNALANLAPSSRRKRQLWVRAKRLRAVWGEARVKRALRM